MSDILPLKNNLTGGGLQKPQDAAAQGGFSAPRLSDEAESLPRREIEADSGDGVNPPSYAGREFDEGKKITWKEFLSSVNGNDKLLDHLHEEIKSFYDAENYLMSFIPQTNNWGEPSMAHKRTKHFMKHL